MKRQPGFVDAVTRHGDLWRIGLITALRRHRALAAAIDGMRHISIREKSLFNELLVTRNQAIRDARVLREARQGWRHEQEELRAAKSGSRSHHGPSGGAKLSVIPIRGDAQRAKALQQFAHFSRESAKQ